MRLHNLMLGVAAVAVTLGIWTLANAGERYGQPGHDWNGNWDFQSSTDQANRAAIADMQDAVKRGKNKGYTMNYDIGTYVSCTNTAAGVATNNSGGNTTATTTAPVMANQWCGK